MHYEFYKDPAYIGFSPAPGADVLVLAGDIGSRATAVARFMDWPVPVILTAGNHELYGGFDYGLTIKELREACAGTNVHFLEKDSLVLPTFLGVRFLGTILWTDYCLFGRPKQSACMIECGEALGDHSQIRSQGRKFMPKDALFRHVESKRWMNLQFAIPYDGKTVVITHHGCHRNSIANKHQWDLVSAGFASDMTAELDHADLWVHGHTHDSFQYTAGRARVYVNPRGYPLKAGFENPRWDPALVIDI